MKQVNSFLIAFSMYSRIPVPQPDWELPWVSEMVPRTMTMPLRAS